MEDKQREYFKDLLIKERGRIEQSLRSAVLDLKDNAEQPIGDQIDEAVSINQTAMSIRMKERDKKLLAKIGLALSRIENNTFGECDDCGEEIGIKRLEARPVTTLCVLCKEKQERRESSFA